MGTGSKTRKGRRDAVAGNGLLRLVQVRDRINRQLEFDRRIARWALPLVVLYLLSAITLGPLIGLVFAALIVVFGFTAQAAIRNKAALGANASLLATVMIVVWVLPAMTGHAVTANPGVIIAAIAAAAGAFMTERHNGSRLVTVLVGHAGCLVAGAVSLVWPWQGGLLAVAWVVGVIVWRTGALLLWQVTVARVRSRLGGGRMRVRAGRALPTRIPSEDDFTPENVAAGLEAEQTTGDVLSELPAQWSVLHSRSLPGTHADVDHLAIGRSGVFVLDSKNWAGKLTQSSILDESGDEFIEYRINGSADWLVERLAAPLFEARKVEVALSLPEAAVEPVLVFNDRMQMPNDVITLTVYGAEDPVTGGVMDREVHLVQVRALREWMLARPEHVWRRRSRLGQLLDRARHRDPAQTQQEVSDRFLFDMGVYADYVLPPA